MAGAFDDFTPPQQTPPAGGGAFSDFTPPSAASGAQQSWPDYLLDHLHRFAQGVHTAATVATDAPTFGLMDKLFSNLPRPQQSQQNPFSPTGDPQADTAQAYRDAGPYALPLAIAGSAMTGQGELAGAKAIGEALAPKIGNWAGGVLGSGAVGAGTSALGAYGHEAGLAPDVSDIGKQTLIGLGVGALGGVPGGLVGRGAAPASAPIPTLKTNQETAFTNAGNVLFNNADIRQKAAQALTDIDNAAPRVGIEGQGAQKVLNDLSTEATGRGVMSAERVNDYVNKLHNFNTGDGVPVAGQIGQGHLNDLLQTGTPIVGAPGAGAQAIENAKKATGLFEDTSRLANWQYKASKGGPTVADQAGSWLRSDEGQRFAPQGTPLNDALTTLFQTPVPPKLSASPSSWDVRHVLSHVIEPVALGMTGGAAGGATGGWDWEHMGEGAGTALALGYGVHKVLPFAQNVARSGPYQAAQDAARAVASTGLPQKPVLPPASLRDAFRTLLYGPGQTGAY